MAEFQDSPLAFTVFVIIKPSCPNIKNIEVTFGGTNSLNDFGEFLKPPSRLRNATASRIGNDVIIVVITPLSSTKYSLQQIFTLFLK